MSIDLPEFLESGELARLIPVAPSGHKERYAASVLLATVTIVAPFARDVLATIGRRLGARSRVHAYTEVVLKTRPTDNAFRPDGLLIVDTSRSEWRALIEAKIGPSKIDPGQIEKYAEIARENDIHAVISISNELTAIPEQTPYEYNPRSNNKVAVYHWSWMKIVTLATLLISSEEDFDPEQHFILKEMLRYFSHSNIDVRGFHEMNSDWRPLVTKVQAGGQLRRNDIDVVNTIRSWHQEQHDVCLILSRKLKVPVSLRLSSRLREDQSARVAEDAAKLADDRKLSAEFDIPDVAGSIEVIADILRRNVLCRMRIEAPDNLKKYSSRLNWLLRQLPEESSSDTILHIHWKGGGLTFAPIKELRENPEIADLGRPNSVPKAFEIAMVSDLERKFSGPRTFIEGLEEAVPRFYDSVARHIEPWKAAPPEGPVRDGVDELGELVERLPGPPKSPEKVVRTGQINGRSFAIYEDGSIQVETPHGVKWFKDLATLNSFANLDQ